MAVSKINDNRMVMKSFTSQQFTISAGGIGQAQFDVETFDIPGYRKILWRYATASTVGLRNNVNYFLLGLNTVKAQNLGSTSETGTVSINIFYLKEDQVIVE